MVCPAKIVDLQRNAVLAVGVHAEMPICICELDY